MKNREGNERKRTAHPPISPPPGTYYGAILFLHSGKIPEKSFRASLQPNQWLLVSFIAFRQPLFVVPCM